MILLSLKDYAKQSNVSYEAVRKQVTRYKKDLEGHLIRDGRQQLLDEEAVAFLDERRQRSPIAVFNQDKDEQIEKLKGDLDAAKTFIIALQQEQARLKDEKHALELKAAEVVALEATAASLRTEKESLEARAQDAEKNAQEASQELLGAQQRIAELENRKWYELLFKKKEK